MESDNLIISCSLLKGSYSGSVLDLVLLSNRDFLTQTSYFMHTFFAIHCPQLNLKRDFGSLTRRKKSGVIYLALRKLKLVCGIKIGCLKNIFE